MEEIKTEEQVYTYDLKNKNKVFAQNRKEFYKRQVKSFKEEGEPLEAVEVVNIFLFNTDGELLIQKRGKSKSHNPGLLDKSIGGHITFGDTADFTAMVETVEELQTPSIVLRDFLDFEKTRKLLSSYTESIAIMKLLVTDFFDLPKVINGEKISIVNRSHLYLGLYDGKVRPSDKEASGILYYTMDDLKDELESNPETFTQDLHIYFKKFEKDFRDFVDHIKS